MVLHFLGLHSSTSPLLTTCQVVSHKLADPPKKRAGRKPSSTTDDLCDLRQLHPLPNFRLLRREEQESDEHLVICCGGI